MSSRDNALRLVDAARPAVSNVVVHQSIDSTHAWALRLIEQVESEEIVLPTTMVIAFEQDHGHGRAGRLWESPPGGLYLSWIVAGLDAPTIALLPMIAAAAAHTAISAIGIDAVEIKWPNDILVGGRKLAGLLVHSRHGATSWATVGIGINIDRAPMIRDGSTTRPSRSPSSSRTAISRPGPRPSSGSSPKSWPPASTSPVEHIGRWREHLHHRSAMR